jgi:hypothetical protein
MMKDATASRPVTNLGQRLSRWATAAMTSVRIPRVGMPVLGIPDNGTRRRRPTAAARVRLTIA